MSLNMYLGETRSQSISMNSICTETIQGMERAISAIDTFRGNMLLQGKTYESAKEFMSQTYRPLAKGIIYLCEELIRQNDRYPEQFQAQVAETDLVQHEVEDQIRQIDRLIIETEELSNSIPLIGSTIGILQNMKARLEDKLNRLHTFNSASASNYETAMELASNVAAGLAQIQGGNGFNRHNGTFTTDGMNMDWVRNIQEVRAYTAYPDHLRNNPEDTDKIITILIYEEANPQYVRQTDEFLEPLAEQDVVEIKYLIYSAEEPYRTMGLKYLGELELIPADIDPNNNKVPGPSFFSEHDNSITYVFERDRTNDRGKYFTFFHELAHAIDFNYGMELGMDGFYSDHFKSNGQTLTEYMYEDVENRIQLELENELNKEKYSSVNMETKTNMIHNVAEYFIYKGPANETLTPDELELYRTIMNQMSGELRSDEHHNASDVYGGVTLNQIKGKWAHHDDGYWIYEDSGERRREPNREGFASYYGSIMLEDGDFRDKHIDSVDEYLPNSKQHIDEMFDKINEGENE